MPASTSDTRNRWKKRKRESQTTRKSTQYDDELDEELQDEEIDDNQTNSNPKNHSTNTLPPISHELLSDTPIRVSEFPPVIKHKVHRPHSSVIAILNAERGYVSKCGVSLENVSYGQIQALSVMSKESLVDYEKSDGGSFPFVITPPKILEGHGVVKRFGNDRVLVVPMHADWFSPNTVHRLERQVVPLYFSGKSADHTPEKYMECRNKIVAKCMGNADKRLAMSDCDGLVIGVDNDDMSRIFRFLDHWGIINYCVPALNGQTQNDGLCLKEDTTGELRVPMNLLKTVDSLIQFDKPKCQQSAADVYSQLSGLVHGDSDLDSKIRERLSENRCSCCSRSLPIIYYQSQKEADVQLCMLCFNEGRFIAGHSSLDFTRFDSGTDYGDLDGENWSDQETLLLLEAMEVYVDNWNEIAEHVKTKSKAQCILHFLRFPIDDSSLNNIEVPQIPISVKLSNNDECDRSYSNGHSAGSTPQDPNAESRVPFSNYANPVMALVAFLASAVGPRVAAAFAHATLIELSKDDHVAASDYSTITNSSREKDSTPLSDAKLRAASKAGLSAAATKAKLFADHEEREIQRLSANIINHQLKRLELKLKQFTEVETMLMKECEHVDRAKQRIAAERAASVSTQFGPAGVTGSTSLSAGHPAMIHNNAGNTRQQTISDMPSQPYMSYANNQPFHPHVSPMSQQPTYGLGPSLPLSAINPSSASPNTTNCSMSRPVSGTRSGVD